MSEPVPDAKYTSPPEPAEDPWRVAFEEFKKRDEKMVADYREEIDTLLVFVRRRHRLFIFRLINSTSQAGLFSAVLTAFVVESYQSLQEDYTQTSVDLLRQISRQLANASFPAAGDSSQFQAQRSDVRVNVCWFVSLLLSLIVALFGIFMKQWMRAYMKWTDVTPDRDAVALRLFRYRSLEAWRLEAILALLPTLLQLSVILFLSGLLVFLWHLDPMVAHVMAVLLATTFFLVAAVTVLPAVSQSCPFRSPLSEILAVPFWRVADYSLFLLTTIWTFVQFGFRYYPSSYYWEELSDRWRHRSKLASWVQADEAAVVAERDDDVSIHVSAMVHLCCTTESQQLWSAALTAIMAEYPAQDFMWLTRNPHGYFNQVWWPVLGCISILTEEDLKSNVGRWRWRIPYITTTHFKRLSSTMKDCWVSFLLHSERIAVFESRSTRVAESYMICCVATMESTTGGPLCMQAFMEVLKAHFRNLEGSQLNIIADCLEYCSEAALVHSLSGLSSPGRMVS
jgi:hypothetical protein